MGDPTTIKHIEVERDGGMVCTRCGGGYRMGEPDVRAGDLTEQQAWIARHKDCPPKGKHTLRIELSDEMRTQLEAAVAEANRVAALAGTPQFTLVQCVSAALAKGLGLPPSAPPDQVPLAALSVAQFCNLIGHGDLAAARAAAAQARAHQEQIEAGTRQIFKDVQRVAGMHAPIRLKSAQEVGSWARGVQEGISANPLHTIVLCYAIVDEAEGGFPMPAAQGKN